MKIAIIDDYPDFFRKLSSYPRLKDHEVVVFNDTEKDAVKLAERLKDADAVVLTQQRSPFTRAVIERLPKLKLIAQTGRNTNHVDIAACTENGIAVAAAGHGSASSTVELTWALILSAMRNIPLEVEQLKKGVWQTSVGKGLSGKTLGVYSYGRIGSSVAEVGKAFGMRVICWGREGSLAKAKAGGFEAATSREAFFETADVVTLHIALNKETRGIITPADLARMRPGSMIVNTSRGPLIAEGALVAALEKGRPGFAAIDVYEDEPVVGGNHPLFKMANVVCTPHLGYVEEGTLESYYGTAIDSILAYAAGKPENVLNPQALEKK